MSDVRRYEFDENGVCYHQPDGPFVSYDDYARLKADAQVILKHLDEASADCARLKAEVERLRKAGDELALSIAAFHLLHRGSIDTTTQPDIVAWNAAKEGKQP